MSVEEDVRRRLQLITEKDARTRAFIRVDGADALAAAKAADEKSAEEAPRPLDGVTLAVKDNLAVAGKPWTAGVNGRQGVIASDDAIAVARLRDAGAIILGGANMDEAALGAVTDNPTFGHCLNPLGEGLTPGGSSGGSAAALAAGFVDLALGTDTMGSVRVPAAYCGVFGFKPSFEAIDRDGLAMLAPSLDTIGPMARDIGMLRRAFDQLCQPDVIEPVTGSLSIAGLRVGVPAQLSDVAIDDTVLRGLAIAMEALRRLGAEISEVDLRGWRPGKSRKAGLLITEAEGAAELRDLIDRPGAISANLLSMLDYGRNAPSEKVALARTEVERAARSALEAFDLFDILLMPTTPQRAFHHGNAIPSNQADLTALANFAKCPAIALPIEVGAEELPASVQLMAPPGEDHRLLLRAEQLADELEPPAGAT